MPGPKGAAETRPSGPATCEAPHLKGQAGASGHGRAHPLGSPRSAAARSSVPEKPASYRRARRLLISEAPAPPPPPAAAAAPVAAAAVVAAADGGQDTTSSGLHRHVRRAANCIVGGEGTGRGRRREREKEEDPLRGGG